MSVYITGGDCNCPGCGTEYEPGPRRGIDSASNFTRCYQHDPAEKGGVGKGGDQWSLCRTFRWGNKDNNVPVMLFFQFLTNS